MLLKSICITWSCDEEIILLLYNIFYSTSNPSINSTPDINESIRHILLSLADLSLIYSCRLHGQSICHATRSINLYTGCVPRDREICLLYPACSVIEESVYQLHNWSTHIPAACSVMEEPTYLLATQLANLRISCIPRWGICLPAAYSVIRQSVYFISHAIGQSMS